MINQKDNTCIILDNKNIECKKILMLNLTSGIYHLDKNNLDSNIFL